MFRQILRTSLTKHNFKFSARHVTNEPPQTNERKLIEVLRTKFKGDVKVSDVSGGCGAMFEVYIKSSEFKNLPIVKQHQMVNSVLKEEVKQMHGIRIFTEAE